MTAEGLAEIFPDEAALAEAAKEEQVEDGILDRMCVGQMAREKQWRP
jgi:hypothetical protein